MISPTIKLTENSENNLLSCIFIFHKYNLIKVHYMKVAGIFLCLFFAKFLFAQEIKWNGKSVDFSHGELKVSDNHGFLVFEDGTPFFYLGDTAWELFHRLSKDDAEK